MYKYYQPNEQDLKDQQPDCVIRALTKVLDVTWLEAFESLIPYARKLQTTLTCIQCYEKYLFDAGFKYVVEKYTAHTDKQNTDVAIIKDVMNKIRRSR